MEIIMDVLTDLLGAMKLRGDIFFRCAFSGPWGMQIFETPVAEFHLIVEGSCWVEVAGESEPVTLNTGDIVVFPHGNAHVLLDALTTEPVAARTIVPQPPKDYGTVQYGGVGKPTGILCGYFSFDRQSHSALLRALPPFIHISADTVAADFPWLQTCMHFINHETHHFRPGTEAVVSRLVEVMFIQIMRATIATSDDAAGLLGAIADPRVGKALNAMHEIPEHPWTLELLAGRAGMSRSAFAAAFLLRVGQTPMQYLTEWRMHRAKHLLASSRNSIGSIAEQCGYQSESAFSKAFKNQFSQSPGAFRSAKS